jgi:hypothetical protein
MLSIPKQTSDPSVPIGAKGPFGLFPIKFTPQDFHSHIYITGTIGTGKSKLIQHLLYQITIAGVGCGIIDPHSDLATDLIAQLASYPKRNPWLYQPKNQTKIIYVDPFHSDHVVPANVLKSSFAAPQDLAETIVEAFRRVWPATLAEAPRFSQILRHSVMILIDNGLSLVELEPLLTDHAFRTHLLSRAKDEPSVSFFKQQYDRWGRDQLVFASPVLNKVSAFLFRPQIRAMLGASDNQLDFRTILDEGKLLIINLGGVTSDDTQRLLGALFLTGVEKAALSRENIRPHERNPFFFFIDEFGMFAAHDCSHMTKILSECRKYRLHLGLAHQTISQLDSGRLSGALENAKLKIMFNCGRETATAVMNQIFMPDPSRIKHEVRDEDAQGRTHPLFESLLNQTEKQVGEVMRLPNRHIIVKLPDNDELVHLKTPTVPKPRISWDDGERIRRYLTKQAGLPIQELEHAYRTRTSMNHPTPHPSYSSSPYAFWKPTRL